jgi:hypothetical protein
VVSINITNFGSAMLVARGERAVRARVEGGGIGDHDDGNEHDEHHDLASLRSHCPDLQWVL